MADIIENRAPICATCRYLKVEMVTEMRAIYEDVPILGGLLGFRSKRTEKPVEVMEWFCSIARDPVRGLTVRRASCADERSREAGCGLAGRNYVANPRWIADLQARGIEVHPDLMTMYAAPEATDA